MTKTRENRGIAIANILMFSMVLVTIAFISVTRLVVHLGVTNKVKNSRHADNLARSVVAAAWAELDQNPNFGQSPTDRLEITSSEWGDNASAFLHFDSGSGEPYSVYNLNGDTAIPGYNGTTVPAKSVQFIAQATYQGTTKVVEILVTQPGFKHAAASSGRLSLNGRSEAAGLDSYEQVNAIAENGSVDAAAIEDDLLKTSIATAHANYPIWGFDADGNRVIVDWEKPLKLLGDLDLYGDAISGGEIEQSGTVRYHQGGMPKINQSVELPSLDLHRFDPVSRDDVNALDGSYAGGSFSGFNRRSGDLVINGDLDLDGALLYVSGNVTITGSVKGEGAIVSTGNVSITGHAEVNADSQVAVAAEGDLTVSGVGKDRSLFTGILYSTGNMNVGNITTVGAVIANGPGTDGDGSTTTVSDSRVLNFPDATKFDVVGQQGLPNLPQQGQSWVRLAQNGISIPAPDVTEFQNPDGSFTWNPALITVNYGGQTYSDPNDPALQSQLSSTAKIALETGYSSIIQAWEDFINGLEAPEQRETTVFRLDLNEFLTVAEKMKVVSWRTLNG